MLYQFFGNWISLSVVSCIATALLIFFSWKALGNLDLTVIMAIRILGVAVLISPMLIRTIVHGETGFQGSHDAKFWIILVLVGFFAGGILVFILSRAPSSKVSRWICHSCDGH